MTDVTRAHHTRLVDVMGKVITAHRAIHESIATHAEKHAAEREEHLRQLDTVNRLNGLPHGDGT